jgi:hypothetical protein
MNNYKVPEMEDLKISLSIPRGKAGEIAQSVWRLRNKQLRNHGSIPSKAKKCPIRFQGPPSLLVTEYRGHFWRR